MPEHDLTGERCRRPLSVFMHLGEHDARPAACLTCRREERLERPVLAVRGVIRRQA